MCGHLSGACALNLMVVLLAALPALVQAQFTWTTNNGAITITGYTGSVGVVTIPDRIPGTSDGLPSPALGTTLSASAAP